MARDRQQERPIHRRFRLACAALTCLFLLVSAVPRAAVADTLWHVTGYAVKKAAGFKLPAKERECRKRASAGKAATAGGAADVADLPPQPVLVPACAGTASAGGRAGIFASDAARQAGGARAPPAMAA